MKMKREILMAVRERERERELQFNEIKKIGGEDNV